MINMNQENVMTNGLDTKKTEQSNYEKNFIEVDIFVC